jgi:uncharacterized protein YndB with AHSA1/START domain
MEFEFSAIIDRPPADVFAFFRDVDRHAGREGSVVPVYDRITPGPIGVGARYREVVKLSPFVAGEMISEITRFEPDECLEYKFSGLGMDGKLVYRFEAAGDGTRVLQRQYLWPRGVLRFLRPVIKVAFSLAAGRRLASIKRLLES